MACYIYYRVSDTVTGELLALMRCYSDGTHKDFDFVAEALRDLLGRHYTISSFAMNWAEADTLAAVGIPLIIYDPEERRSDADKYSDTTEYASCDWTNLTDFLSLKAMSAS